MVAANEHDVICALQLLIELDSVNRDRDIRESKDREEQAQERTGGAGSTEGSISVAALPFVPRHCSVLF